MDDGSVAHLVFDIVAVNKLIVAVNKLFNNKLIAVNKLIVAVNKLFNNKLIAVNKLITESSLDPLVDSVWACFS